jgi:hypothetical protein
MMNWKSLLLLSILHRIACMFGVMGECIICSNGCASSLSAVGMGRGGKDIPLCNECFDDPYKLLHATAFAKGCWVN